MKSILFYFLQSVLASGILYAYYHLALRNKKFHQYNRFYLLGSVIISILIPFLHIPLYFEETEMRSSVVLQTLQTISFPAAEPETVVVFSPAPASFNWNIVLYGLYILAIAMLLTRVLFSLRKIRMIIKNHPVEELNGIHFINTTEPGTPYSFFRWLFWNEKIELRSEKGEQIFRHEIFHIQQKHSLDILFMELATAIFWINPFFHLIKREQKAIHEFLADQFALRKTDKWEYAELLLMQALSTQQPLVNPFFHNQIKRRIAMITNPQKTSHRYLRKVLVLPITAAVMILFAFTYKNKGAEPVIRAGESITIVVDAGHGGIDQGVKSPDNKFTEAQLNLELAKKIQSLASEYNVSVIMTRTGDNLPGGATTINQGLINRANIGNSTNPNAFISVHINATGKQINRSSSGIEAYITKDRSNPHDQLLASAILKEMAGVYNTRMEIRQRKEAGVFILDKATCPAVLLECGYMSNPDDLAFITQSKNQEKIARAILSGIVKCADNGVGYKETPIDTVPYIEVWDAPPSPVKKSPTAEQLKKWADGKIYGVWLDGKRIANTSLENYKPADFGLYFVSKLEKNAANYGKHYYQVELMTHNYYEKAYGNHDLLLRRTAYRDTSHPLIVIDGKARPGLTISGVEKEVSANDIVSINVLKAPASTTKYGKAGKNGVIEIFVKKDKVVYKEVTISDLLPDKQDNKVFEKVEIEPSFPGGETIWKKYLEKTLNSSVAVENNAPEGEYTVYIQFIVYANGDIGDVKPLTNHGFGMEQEAMRVIKKGPKWVPAIQNGKKVSAYRKQPITFVVGKGTNPVSIYNNTEIRNKNLIKQELDPRKLYIGIDNSFLVVKTDELAAKDVYATISQGKIRKEGDNFIVNVSNAGSATIHFYSIENGSKINLKDVSFDIGIPVALPASVFTSSAGETWTGNSVYTPGPYTGKISISELKKTNPIKLMGLPEEAKLLSFTFTIDVDRDAVTIINTGDQFNEIIQKLINNIEPEHMIVMESVRIVWHGKIQSIPARFWDITN